MRSPHAAPRLQKQIIDVAMGWRLSACVIPLAFTAFVLIAVISVSAPRVTQEAEHFPINARKPDLWRTATSLAVGAESRTTALGWTGGRFADLELNANRPARALDLGNGIRSVASPVALSGDGGTRIVGGSDGSVCIWRAGECARLSLHETSVASVVCSADGRYVASTDDTSLVLWDAESRKPLLRQTAIQPSVKRLALSADGSRLAVIHAGDVVHVWAVSSSSVVYTLRASHCVSVARLSPDGSHLACSDQCGGIYVHEVPGGQVAVASKSVRSPLDNVTAMHFSPDGRLLACGRSTGSIELWSIETSTRLSELPGHDGQVTALCFSTRGDRLFSTGCDATLRTWDVARYDELQFIELRRLMAPASRFESF